MTYITLNKTQVHHNLKRKKNRIIDRDTLFSLRGGDTVPRMYPYCILTVSPLYPHCIPSKRGGGEKEKCLKMPLSSMPYKYMSICPVCQRTNVVHLSSHLVMVNCLNGNARSLEVKSPRSRDNGVHFGRHFVTEIGPQGLPILLVCVSKSLSLIPYLSLALYHSRPFVY